MAMGIVDSETFESEIANLIGGKKSPPKIVEIERGRGNTPETPESLRKIIGDNAISEGSKATKALTDYLGISDSSLSAYKNGATSTSSYHRPNLELKQHVEDKKIKIATRAKSRLLKAINHITSDKLEKEDARSLAGIAKDMSAVVKNIEPEMPTNSVTNGPTYIIYAPQMKKEETYDVIQINE